MPQDGASISGDEVMATRPMADDETTLQTEDSALMNYEDGNEPADNSSANALQSPHQMNETPAKSNSETSKSPEVTGKYRYQDLDITESVSEQSLLP